MTDLTFDRDFGELERRGARVRREERAIGDFGARKPVLHHCRFTGSASYNTGGDPLTVPPGISANARGMPTTAFVAATLYVLIPDSDLSDPKVLVTDEAGTEVASTTNISAIADVPVLVVDQAADVLNAYRAGGARRVVGLDLSVGADVERDVSNYWTIQAMKRSRGQDGNPQDWDDYVEVGSAVVTDNLALEAAESYELFRAFDLDGQFELAPGDDVLLSIKGTGTPAALVGVRLGILSVERR